MDDADGRLALEAALERGLLECGAVGQHLLLAVSGGPDSLALLLGCHALAGRLGLKLTVATVDHQLRPESAGEALQVQQRCADLGVPCRVLAVEVGAGAGLEARARHERYAALQGARREVGAQLVATGHTATDQAETLLMRLARGSATAGAAGVEQVRADGVIRPLLGVTRVQVEAYLAARGVEAARDPMNEDVRFLRARIRREVLRALQSAVGPGVVEALARHARLAAEDEALLGALATGALARLHGPAGLERVGLAALERPVARRVVALWLRGAGVAVDAALVDAVLASARAEGPARVTAPGDQVVEVGERLSLAPAPPRRIHGTSRQPPGQPPGDGL